MRLLRWLAVLVAVPLLGVLALVVGARFADGPVAIVAGGPFKTGELRTGPEPDWSFAHDVREVEFQLVEPARSRVTWILEHDGRIYIPSGYMTTWWGKLWKQWPLEAERDGRAILRIGAVEILYIEAVPPRVSIQEAIRLAEAYGGPDSPRFVNGVLDALFKRHEGHPS